MTYDIEGRLSVPFHFERVDQFDMTLDGGVPFRLPTEVSKSELHHFWMRVQAQDTAAARFQAMERLRSFCDWFSYRFDVAVTNLEINTIVQPGGLSEYTATYDLAATHLSAMTESDAASAVQNYPQTASAAPDVKPRIEAVFSLYRDARTATDPVRRFWSFYAILLILLPPTPPTTSDRKPIDEYIRRIRPNDSIYVSDDPSVRGNSLTVAIRDSFSHSGGKYNGGQSPDFRQLLVSHLPALQEIVRRAIKDHLPVT